MSDKRRKIWGEEAPPEDVEAPAIPSESPKTVLEQIPLADKKSPRDRKWEQKHKSVSYRGVPQEIDEAMKEIAKGLDVTRDEVARAFLEYSLACYEDGSLSLNPSLSRSRMTLFPDARGRRVGRQVGWRRSTEDPAPPLKRRETISQEGSFEWKRVTSYRIPEELKRAIQGIHKEMSKIVPIGEIVTSFLAKAMDDYWSGVLVLQPQPMGRNTLFPE